MELSTRNHVTDNNADNLLQEIAKIPATRKATKMTMNNGLFIQMMTL